MITELTKEQIKSEIEYCDIEIDNKRAKMIGINAEIQFVNGQKNIYNSILKVMNGDD